MNVDPKTTSFWRFTVLEQLRRNDSSRFPQCSQEYVVKFEEALTVSTTPLLLKQKKEGDRLWCHRTGTLSRSVRLEEGGHDETYDRDESKRWKRCHHCLKNGDEPWHPTTEFGEHLKTCRHRLAKKTVKKTVKTSEKKSSPKKQLAAAVLFESSGDEEPEPVEQSTRKAKKQKAKPATVKSWAKVTTSQKEEPVTPKPKGIQLPTGPRLSRRTSMSTSKRHSRGVGG